MMIFISQSNGRPVSSHVADQIQTTSLRHFTVVSHRILEDIHRNLLTLYRTVNVAALHSELQGITIVLLEQCTAHTKSDVAGTKTMIHQIVQNLLNAVLVDTISLDDTHIIQDLIPLLVDRNTKLLFQKLGSTKDHSRRIA